MGSLQRATCPFNVKRIAIIGAGPSGLAVAKYLVAENSFSTIDVFEQQSQVGGVWNYTANVTGSCSIPQTNPYVPVEVPLWPKDLKDPVFTSPMYDRLNTNIPKDLMRFSDLKFPPNSLLFPTRQCVQDYLIKYSHNVRHLISFSTQISSMHLNGDNESWHLTTLNVKTQEKQETDYDAVVVASGHYSVPFIPDISGIREWTAAYPNSILHSKHYRYSEPFRNKKVIVVGNAASGVDIGTQISLVCTQPLLNSVKQASDLQLGQEHKEEVPPITEFLISDRSIKFEDGRLEKDIDYVVFCTGYFYSYPFLAQESLSPPLITTGSRTRGLYKQLLHIAHPTLAFTALPQRIIPFPLSEVQAAVLARLWSNRLPLPPRSQMEAWEKDRVEEKGEGKAFHVLGWPADAEYINELSDWAMRADGNDGKTPPRWNGRELWMRQIYIEAKKAFAEGAEKATSLEELGFLYENWVEEKEMQEKLEGCTA